MEGGGKSTPTAPAPLLPGDTDPAPVPKSGRGLVIRWQLKGGIKGKRLRQNTAANSWRSKTSPSKPLSELAWAFQGGFSGSNLSASHSLILRGSSTLQRSQPMHCSSPPGAVSGMHRSVATQKMPPEGQGAAAPVIPRALCPAEHCRGEAGTPQPHSSLLGPRALLRAGSQPSSTSPGPAAHSPGGSGSPSPAQLGASTRNSPWTPVQGCSRGQCSLLQLLGNFPQDDNLKFSA